MLKKFCSKITQQTGIVCFVCFILLIVIVSSIIAKEILFPVGITLVFASGMFYVVGYDVITENPWLFKDYKENEDEEDNDNE